MEYRKILSIDFDYIMYPCIKLYNDMSYGGENSTVVWNIIENQRGVDQFLMYDPESYKNIFKLIRAIMDHYDAYTRLISIKEHDEIINRLKSENYDNTMYDLVNIDFHHDIMYNPKDKTQLLRFDKYTCANWVGYLFAHNKLNSYTWIKAPNSDPYDHRLDGDLNIKFESMNLSTALEDGIVKYAIDQGFKDIYFCLSPQWVPYKFKHLYDLIVEMYDMH